MVLKGEDRSGVRGGELMCGEGEEDRCRIGKGGVRCGIGKGGLSMWDWKGGN